MVISIARKVGTSRHAVNYIVELKGGHLNNLKVVLYGPSPTNGELKYAKEAER